MKNISIKEAQDLLTWAEKQNPGAWGQHSKNVARAAKTIAEKCGLDSELAFKMGLLHDIGRYKGVSHMRHVIFGYELMKSKGLNDEARICLTHSFPIANIDIFSGQNDCDEKENDFIQRYISTIEYNDYDKLLQLCDALGDAKGIITIESRLLDVAIRRGINEHTLDKWKAFYNLKEYFDAKCLCNVYYLFYDEICKSIMS